MRMDNVVGNTWNGKVTDNTNAEEYKVTGIRWAKESITRALDLANIKLKHLLLHFTDNAAEYICDGQPKENIDIPGNPLRQRML